ncbi:MULTISPECIES: hypothetical protein [Glaesserella]|uniref:hypothetical protein n=1 Tax=Glaesserella TaxID=2094023 RepID=UPI001403B766|nr:MULTISPECIES: hypothetical protein [Glaesserella]
MKHLVNIFGLILLCSTLSACLVTSVVGATVGAATTVVGAAVDVADAVTPDITD